MHRVTVLILVLDIFFVKTSGHAIDFHKTGWIPISREDALKRGSNSRFISDDTVDESSQNMQMLRENAIKVVSPEKQILAFNFLPETAVVKENHAKTNECEFGGCLSNVVENNYEANNSSSSEETSKNISLHKNRKAKAITARTLEANNLSDTQESQHFKNKLAESKFEKDNKSNENQETQNSYKVIEVSDNFTELISKESKQNIKKSGYAYQSPKNNINFLPKANLTSSFLSILNRYNIKPEDQSENYIISRNRAYTPKPNYMLVPIPVRFWRYNSLNHLPVDPLIAVFLSNYGYYLPSYYGLHNNYRNLYGYLASNNIHNNLPFGLYKIFSDTDSSN